MIKSVFGIGRSNNPYNCVLQAVKEVKSPKLLFFFSDEDYFQDYSKILHEMYPDAICIGCTAYRTWNRFAVGTDVLNVISIEAGITCSAGVIEKADSYALQYMDNVKKCADEIGKSENTVCIEFTVPHKRAEEYAIMALNSVLLRREIAVVGGTAATVRDNSDGLVSLNGKIYKDGCVFVLVHNENGKIKIVSENIYEPLTGREFTVTKANNLTRTIMQFDGRVAADVYAEELGVPRNDISKMFNYYPMGRRVNDKIYITAIHEEGSKGSLKCHARVYEETKMMVMKEGDYTNITQKTIKDIQSDIKNPSVVFVLQCVARTKLFEQNDFINEHHRMITEAFPNFIGYSCLGEQMGTKNFNNTLLLVIFE